MRYLWMTLSAAAMVALDQLTKLWTVRHIPLGGAAPAWEGVFHLTYVQNTGMAFSMLRGGRWLFLIVTAVVLTALCVLVARGKLRHPVALAAVTCIVGGGVGNLIDRLLHGYVVDMIALDFMDFAVLNAADCFVCIGAGLLLLWALVLDRKETKKP